MFEFWKKCDQVDVAYYNVML